MRNVIVGFLVVVACIFVTSCILAQQEFAEKVWVHCGDSETLKVEYQDHTGEGPAIYGKAWPAEGETYGVKGENKSDSGAGVYGLASATKSTAYGVYGSTMGADGAGIYGIGSGTGVWGVSSDGYGVYAEGGLTGVCGVTTTGDGVTGICLGTDGKGVCGIGTKYGVYGVSSNGYAVYSGGDAYVDGNLVVSGSIKSTNLALNTANNPVTVWASSEHGPLMIQGKECTYWASYINDGKAGYWDKYEWATDGEKNGNFQYSDPSTGLQGAKIELKWEKALSKMTRVVIYPRPNKYDKVEDCFLQVMQEDGTVNNIHLGQLHTPREIKLEDAEGENVKAVGVLITETTSNTYNIGLAEIECHKD